MGPEARAGEGLDFAEEFAEAAHWFARHVARSSMSAPVPTCPEWSVLDLVTHLGNVHSWAASVIETGSSTVSGLADEPASHRPRRVAQWYEGRAEDLYAVLRETPMDRPCWNFAYGAGVAGFWHRRMTHETVVHGLDLAVAADLEERLPLPVAADGVDEALTVFLHRMHSRGYPAELCAPVVLRATDAGRAWTVEPGLSGEIPTQASPSQARLVGPDRPEPRVSPGPVAGSVEEGDLVEAPAGMLLRLLWKRARLTDPQVRISGDEERVGRFFGSRLTP